MVRAGERIHVIGIAGSGAAGVAAACAAGRARASTAATWMRPRRTRHRCTRRGSRSSTGHDPAHLAGVDRVAITPAVRAVAEHAELAAAEAAGLPVLPWQALLGRADGSAPGAWGWR